jgi:hypothetical protein
MKKIFHLSFLVFLSFLIIPLLRSINKIQFYYDSGNFESKLKPEALEKIKELEKSKSKKDFINKNRKSPEVSYASEKNKSEWKSIDEFDNEEQGVFGFEVIDYEPKNDLEIGFIEFMKIIPIDHEKLMIETNKKSTDQLKNTKMQIKIYDKKKMTKEKKLLILKELKDKAMPIWRNNSILILQEKYQITEEYINENDNEDDFPLHKFLDEAINKTLKYKKL